MSRANPILIVEDNPNMSSLLSEILDFFEYKTVGAQDGEEALKILGEQSIDLVITDLKMPKMGGIELLRAIKDRFPHLPVVVITGFDNDSFRSDASAAHADGFLCKPFKVDQIKELLRKHLNRQE